MLNKKRLLTPGPTPLPEEVRLALAQDMIHHRKGQFKEIMQRVQGHLRELFGTTQPVLPLSCSGSGAMTAAVYNLFAPVRKCWWPKPASSASAGWRSPAPAVWNAPCCPPPGDRPSRPRTWPPPWTPIPTSAAC